MDARRDTRTLLTRWTTWAPVATLPVLVAGWGRSIPVLVALLIALLLGAAVLAAVHHAEVVAHRVGEPFGSLVLAVAVTIIEVGLILTLTASGGQGAQTLGRDTVFAAVIITCNGIVGVSILAGSKRGPVVFNAEGGGSALATVTILTGVCLVLPTFTTSTPGPQFSVQQLAFAAVASLTLTYCSSSRRPGGTATSSYPSTRRAPRSRTSTPGRRRTGRPGQAPRSCWSRS